MATLKQLREHHGITQSVLANELHTSVPIISNYETGVSLPIFEDMVCLENQFQQAIEWDEKIEYRTKKQVVSMISVLSEHYPLVTVLNFILRAVRDHSKYGSEARLLNHFYSAAMERHEPPLLPL
jgi:transcriptional regulator with XRE-family HTH domain